MAAAALWSWPALSAFIGADSGLREALAVAAGAALYGGIFLLAARWLKLAELFWLLKLLRARFIKQSG